ncbi:MAG TPA: DnaJ domain-containing protein [Stellaceae bacterium]|nr:DnaJ domain-containing protein [Stellaceae bacterium]
MLYLVGGVFLLFGLMLLARVFVNADPRTLARFVKWAAIALAVAAVIALAVSGRLSMLLALAAVLFPLLRRLHSVAGGLRGPSAGATSEIETAYVRMSLDHDTGAMSGTVLRGHFAGMRLDELHRADLLALLRECRTADDEAARLVEAWLDRTDPEWRDELHGEHAEAGAPPPRSGADLTIDEAYAILGLQPGADPAAIKAAHHRLMKQLHPDRGGTDYFAAKINRARDVLLNR